MKRQNSIISLSGGLDSATLLAKYKDNIGLCVFINYGSKQNTRERESSARLAAQYGKQWIEIDARSIFRSFKSALLSHSSEKIAEGDYSQFEESNAKVPFRNAIFASVLVGLAESLDYDNVLLAPHSGDHRLYADCTPLFFSHFSGAVNAYSDGNILVSTPFINMSKDEIAKEAYKLKLPIELTYSCYNGRRLHCGKCPTCLERKKALGENDPTEYEKFEPLITTDECLEVLHERTKLYGNNSFAEHSDELEGWLDAITIETSSADYKKSFEFIKTMLAHKAHRFAMNKKKDSAIDFVNYLIIGRDAGFRAHFSNKFANASLYSTFLYDESSVEEVIVSIAERWAL